MFRSHGSNPDDYKAAVGVQQRIEKWGRYTLVYQPQQADLVWVVWKERKGGNRLPGQPTQMPPVTMPQPSDPGTGPNPGGPGQPGAPGSPRQNPGGIGGPDGVGTSNGGRGVGMVWPVNDQLAVYMPENDEKPAVAAVEEVGERRAERTGHASLRKDRGRDRRRVFQIDERLEVARRADYSSTRDLRRKRALSIQRRCPRGSRADRGPAGDRVRTGVRGRSGRSARFSVLEDAQVFGNRLAREMRAVG